MAMKVSLALGSREPLSRQTAWGCLTSNLALPGSGSLAAGRRVGYPQLMLAALGLFLTMVFGARFFLWFFANWSRFSDQTADPVATLSEMWHALKWAALGIAVFLASCIWALVTSLSILHSAAGSENSNVPPRFYK